MELQQKKTPELPTSEKTHPLDPIPMFLVIV